MSITFYAGDADPQIPVPHECHEDCYPSQEQCDGFDWVDHSVNLANGNAYQALRLLGIEPDYCGEHDAADFVARCMLAIVECAEDDAVGTPSVSTGGPGTGTATWTECGKAPGYWAQRFEALAELGAIARDGGCAITWG